MWIRVKLLDLLSWRCPFSDGTQATIVCVDVPIAWALRLKNWRTKETTRIPNNSYVRNFSYEKQILGIRTQAGVQNRNFLTQGLYANLPEYGPCSLAWTPVLLHILVSWREGEELIRCAIWLRCKCTNNRGAVPCCSGSWLRVELVSIHMLFNVCSLTVAIS